MKPQEQKDRFIVMRAEGKSYSAIAKELGISKSTCTDWEKKLQEQIAERKAEQLEQLYSSYFMTREARIKKLGDTLGTIDGALASADFSQANRESMIISNLLKAYEQTELQAKIDALEAIVGGRA